MRPSTIEPQPTEKPVTILHPKPLGNGGLVTRDLFRSFWMLPSSDDDSIRIGIIPSSEKIRIRTQYHFVIRVYGEHESWDISSPGNVTWEFEYQTAMRPPVLRYLVTVQESAVQDVQTLQAASLQPWIDRGYGQAQWLGPPKMDAWQENDELKRYFLTLNVEQDKETAETLCKSISKKYFQSCRVITRMDLPQIAKVKLHALESNYEKEYEGVFEIIPQKKDFVQVFDIKSSLLSDNRESLTFKPRVFIVPNLENELSLVQSTSLGEYLKSVVPSEIFPNAPIDALKAQAVIARTYSFQTKYHYSDKPFLTCASTLCQVYLGEKTKNKSTSRAIEQTKNMVLKEDNGLFAETFYHAISGGMTDVKSLVLGGSDKSYLHGTNDMLDKETFDLKNNEDVQQYLRADLPTYCSISRFSKATHWTYEFNQPEIKTFLDKAGLKPPLKSITVLKRGISGRATSMKIKTALAEKIITGELQIRSLLGGLPSSLIVFQPAMSGGSIRSFTVLGRGNGHGVGLSQLGAIGRALKGQEFEEILDAYYPGTNLSQIQP
jgi:SpoIID/LytB domain protein